MFDALQDSLRLKTGIVGLMRIFANYAGFLGRKRKMVVGEGAAPPGTLIWRFPGFIRPRCTAGATHKAAESYQGIEVHVPTLHSPSGSLFPVVQISRLSIFPSYGLGSYTALVCSSLLYISRYI